MKVNKHIIHSFSSYILSHEEVIALSFELDQHIPDNVDNNSINTEFELFYFNFKIIPIYQSKDYHESRQNFAILVKNIATSKHHTNIKK